MSLPIPLPAIDMPLQPAAKPAAEIIASTSTATTLHPATVYYNLGPALSAADLQAVINKYDVVVINPNVYTGDLSPQSFPRPVGHYLLGYVPVGSVEPGDATTSALYNAVNVPGGFLTQKTKGKTTIVKDPNDSSANVMNVTNPAVDADILNYAQNIVAQRGLDGVSMDTLDAVIDAGNSENNPALSPAMVNLAVSLGKDITSEGKVIGINGTLDNDTAGKNPIDPLVSIFSQIPITSWTVESQASDGTELYSSDVNQWSWGRFTAAANAQTQAGFGPLRLNLIQYLDPQRNPKIALFSENFLGQALVDAGGNLDLSKSGIIFTGNITQPQFADPTYSELGITASPAPVVPTPPATPTQGSSPVATPASPTTVCYYQGNSVEALQQAMLANDTVVINPDNFLGVDIAALQRKAGCQLLASVSLDSASKGSTLYNSISQLVVSGTVENTKNGAVIEGKKGAGILKGEPDSLNLDITEPAVAQVIAAYVLAVKNQGYNGVLLGGLSNAITADQELAERYAARHHAKDKPIGVAQYFNDTANKQFTPAVVALAQTITSQMRAAGGVIYFNGGLETNPNPDGVNVATVIGQIADGLFLQNAAATKINKAGEAKNASLFAQLEAAINAYRAQHANDAVVTQLPVSLIEPFNPSKLNARPRQYAEDFMQAVVTAGGRDGGIYMSQSLEKITPQPRRESGIAAAVFPAGFSL